MKKWKNVRKTKETLDTQIQSILNPFQAKINAINGEYRWNDWSRRNPFLEIQIIRARDRLDYIRYADNTI